MWMSRRFSGICQCRYLAPRTSGVNGKMWGINNSKSTARLEAGKKKRLPRTGRSQTHTSYSICCTIEFCSVTWSHWFTDLHFMTGLIPLQNHFITKLASRTTGVTYISRTGSHPRVGYLHRACSKKVKYTSAQQAHNRNNTPIYGASGEKVFSIRRRTRTFILEPSWSWCTMYLLELSVMYDVRLGASGYAPRWGYSRAGGNIYFLV
jgi:hypothetical protein